jgi:aspartate/methionine/tyrosine aminotransferase
VTGLSLRGQKLAYSSALPAYLHEHFARLGGQEYAPLCVAENKLVSDLLLAKMSECRNVPASVLGYDRMRGSETFRSALSRMLGRKVFGREFTPEQLVVLAGAGTVLEVLFHVIADPGDAVLIPTPSYAGFWLDLETRDQLHVIPVKTESSTGFRLTPTLLQSARASANRPVRALLFTSPDNPMGRVYSRSEIAEVVAWAEGAGVHLVMDEVYALSVYGPREFVSVAKLGPLGQHVHIVWAFSKDFAASGLRAGVLVSENEDLLRAMDELAYWGCCSGDTQSLLQLMISDDGWVDSFVETNCRRLREAKLGVCAALDALSIPYLEPEAGFFLLLDLRRFLLEPTFAAEEALWRRLLAEANVNLTPGAACRVGEPGFMRLCFAAVARDALGPALERMGRALGAG